MCQAQDEEPKGDQVDWQRQQGEKAVGVRMKGTSGWNGEKDELVQEYGTEERGHVFCLHFSICACHPCAGAMLNFSVSFQFVTAASEF